MSENLKAAGDLARCPICGSTAELGCIYSPDQGWTGLRWRAGEPSAWGNLVAGFGGALAIGEIGLFHGPYVRGIRCESCRRIVLEYSKGEDGPGGELVARASDLEQVGEWDAAIGLYRQVLAEPRYSAHHEYARKGIEAIELRRSVAGPEA